MLQSNSRTALVVCGLGGVVTVWYIHRKLHDETSWLWQLLDDYRRPWIELGTVTSLLVHPVKSAQAFAVDVADATVWGLTHRGLADRSLLLVDANGVAVTARTAPSLLQLQVSAVDTAACHKPVPQVSPVPDCADGSRLQLAHERFGLFVLDLAAVVFNNRLVDVTMSREQRTQALDCGSRVAEWLSQFVPDADNGRLRLLYFAPTAVKVTRTFLSDTKYAPVMRGKHTLNNNRVTDFLSEELIKEAYKTAKCYETNRSIWKCCTAQVALPDATTYMLANERSLDDLNDRFSDGVPPVDMKVMRPNIVVRTNRPYEEDEWSQVRIGEQARFVFMKPCTRCKMTTMDAGTGAPHSSNEPLNTLRKYRNPTGELGKICGLSPLFGINLGLLKAGPVKVNDKVYAKLKQ